MNKKWLDDNLHAGDSWSVGSFKINNTNGFEDIANRFFDIPFWPELTGLGENEELIGFWLKAFVLWDQDKESMGDIEDRLLARPGLQWALSNYASQRLPVFKGQMLGPNTLLWALKKQEYPIVSRERVFEFLQRCFWLQAETLRRITEHPIISLDEPSAFLSSVAKPIWQDFLQGLENQAGLEDIGVALHCCGTPNYEWLEIDWDIIHFDSNELSQSVLENSRAWGKSLHDFVTVRKKWLVLGAISSSPLAILPESKEMADQVCELCESLGLPKVLLSTSCGLGLTQLEDIEKRLVHLATLSQLYSQRSRTH